MGRLLAGELSAGGLRLFAGEAELVRRSYLELLDGVVRQLSGA